MVNRRGVGLAGRRLACLACCLVLAGCGLGQWASNGMKVGPNYKTPEAAVASQWIDYQQPATQPAEPTTQPADVSQWWRVFEDPVLNSLIRDAYAQNLTLGAAGERIAEARAVRGIAIGNIFPQQQELAGEYDAIKASNKTAIPASEQWYRNAEVGFNVGWELDFWGRLRRGIEASDAELEASIADYDNALVLLLSDVAANYIQYRTYQERLYLAHKNVEIQQQAYQLALDNFNPGASTERDPQQAKQVLEQTRALVPDLEAGLRRSSNALCVLLGMPPQDLSQRLGEPGAIPLGEPQLVLGIPADLLRRRPDVRRAERLAAAESANIGIAKAELYPRFFLNGSIGVRAEDVGDLFETPGSLSGFVGPAFQWNILNYGRIENAIKAQEARFRQSVYAYQDAVLRANREAEDAIVSYFKARERTGSLSESVAAAMRTVEITYDQYRQGAIDFTPVFLFEATLTNQQDELARSQGDIALSLVDLYRSLGGGWEAQQDPAAFATEEALAPTTQRAVSLSPATMPTVMNP